MDFVQLIFKKAKSCLDGKLIGILKTCINIVRIYPQRVIQAQLHCPRPAGTLGYVHSPIHPAGFPLVSLNT